MRAAQMRRILRSFFMEKYRSCGGAGCEIHFTQRRGDRGEERKEGDVRHTRKIEPSFLPSMTEAPTSVTVSRAMPHTPMALAM